MPVRNEPTGYRLLPTLHFQLSTFSSPSLPQCIQRECISGFPCDRFAMVRIELSELNGHSHAVPITVVMLITFEKQIQRRDRSHLSDMLDLSRNDFCRRTTDYNRPAG